MLLKELCYIETKTINPQNYPEEEFLHYSLPNFDIDKKPKYEKGKSIMSSKYLVPQNAILFNKLNVRFKRIWNVCDNTYPYSICSEELLPLVVNNSNIVQKYLYYFLLTDKVNNILIENAHGTSTSHQRIKPIDLMNIDVPLPPIKKQNHIVNIIGSIDDLIESNNKLVLKLLSILNNKLEYLITKSTEFIPLKSIISERKERIGLNDVKLLSVVNTGELVLQDEYFDKNTASADMKKYKLIRKFDYAYNPARINIGSIGMLKENYLGAISPIYVVFEIDENYKYYLDFYKSSKYMRKYIEKKSSGSVRQNLPFDEFASIEIPNINTEFLKEFNSLCDLYYKKINDLKTKTIKLQAIKDQYLKKFFG